MGTLTNRVSLKQAVYYLLWKYDYNYSCQPVDYSASEHGLAEVHLVYFYFLDKILDLADTVRQWFY